MCVLSNWRGLELDCVAERGIVRPKLGPGLGFALPSGKVTGFCKGDALWFPRGQSVSVCPESYERDGSCSWGSLPW